MFHHKLLRRLLALICALALCLGLSGPVSAAGFDRQIIYILTCCNRWRRSFDLQC